MGEGKGAKSQKFARIAGKIGNEFLKDFDTTFSAKTSKKTPTVLQTAIKQRFPAVYRKKFRERHPPYPQVFEMGAGRPLRFAETDIKHCSICSLLNIATRIWIKAPLQYCDSISGSGTGKESTWTEI